MSLLIRNLCMVFACAALLVSCQTSGEKIDPDKNNKRAKFHYQIGLDALNRGQLPKAFDELMQSDALLPDQPDTLEALAYAWRLQGNASKSEALYKQVITISPSPSVYTNYGSLLVSLKRFEEAKVILNKALEDPRYRNQYMAFLLLGDALLGQGDIEGAIQKYRKASMMNPNQKVLSQLKEAHAYTVSGRLNYAQALYETLLRRDPILRPALEPLLALLEKRSDLDAARQHLAKYIEKESDPLNRAWASDELTRLGHRVDANKRD